MDQCHRFLLPSSGHNKVSNCYVFCFFLQERHNCLCLFNCTHVHTYDSLVDYISDYNLSDCLPPTLLPSPPSPLSLSLHSWLDWRQQKQVSDVVDYAALHSPGWRGLGAQSFRGPPTYNSSFSPHQVNTVSPFTSPEKNFDCWEPNFNFNFTLNTKAV